MNKWFIKNMRWFDPEKGWHWFVVVFFGLLFLTSPLMLWHVYWMVK